MKIQISEEIVIDFINGLLDGKMKLLEKNDSHVYTTSIRADNNNILNRVSTVSYITFRCGSFDKRVIEIGFDGVPPEAEITTLIGEMKELI